MKILSVLLLSALTSYGATTATFFKGVNATSLSLREHNFGTIAGGGTATLSNDTNLYRAALSGSTFTINLPTPPNTTNGYWSEIAWTNTSGGTQVGSIQVATVSTALVRDELVASGVPTLVTTVTNGVTGTGRLRFETVAGVWRHVDSSGDALSIASGGSGLDTIGFTVDGGGSVIATGKVKGFFTCPYAATITGWNIVADTGTCTIKVWKIATGTAKPTSSNSINTSGVALSTGTAKHSADVTDFTSVVVTANDIFAYNIEAVSGATELTFNLELTK